MIAALFVSLALAQAPAACVGEERWPVKTLTDAEAKDVDLDKSHTIQLDSLAYRFDIVLRGARATWFESGQAQDDPMQRE